jgi:hypothetical protein
MSETAASVGAFEYLYAAFSEDFWSALSEVRLGRREVDSKARGMERILYYQERMKRTDRKSGIRLPPKVCR